MGRIFQLNFSFLNRKHRALISVGNNLKEPYVHVQLIDSLFKKLFSTEHIRYRGMHGYKYLEIYQDPFLKRLLEVIAVEVEKEVNGNYAKVKSLVNYFR
ncbi:MAG TPA: hypothetical protein VGC75_02995 [Candidatus Nitrosocosmicus sp.]